MKKRLYQRGDIFDADQMYGEFHNDAWEDLGKLIGKDDVILDIGSGGADFIAHGAKLFPDNKFIGVEYVDHRHEHALEHNGDIPNLTLVHDRYPCKIPHKPTLILIHGCAFTDDTMDEIYNNLPKGCRVVHNHKKIKELHGSEVKFIIRTSYSKRTKFYLFTK